MIHVAYTRIDIRLRIYFEEVGYDEFSSTEVDEPVYDDSNFLFVHSWFYFEKEYIAWYELAIIYSVTQYEILS
jgi:hypothetical protein